MKVMSREPINMSDTDLMKKLLDGTLDPAMLDDNPHLYTLAERIYGREALEEMGVSGPSIDSYSYVEGNTSDFNDIEMPEFIPNMENIIKNNDERPKRRRKITLLLGLLGLSTMIVNIYIGMGQILCSLGIANMKEICLENNTQVVWTNAYSYGKLHEIDTWQQTGSFEILDMIIIVLSSILVIIGLFFKKS
jgi:hypothetical protein